ncbi:MAG: DMT family transporter [Candidatus Ranarchaeia archaeon]|jgi:drug/metabolite transporter (DMT)-like permease
MEKNWAFASCLSAALIWGTSFPVIKWVYLLYPTINPFVFLFYRFLVTVGVILITFLPLKKHLGFSLAPLRSPKLFVLGCLNASGFVLQYIGQLFTTASKSSLIITLDVLIVAVFSLFLLKEGFDKYKSTGLFFGTIGAVLIIINGDLASLWGGEILGDLLSLSAAFVWSIFIVELKKFLDATEESSGSIALVSLIYTAIPVFIGVLFIPFEFILTFFVSTDLLLAVLFTGIVNSYLGFILWNVGLEKISASTATILLLPQPAVAVFLGIMFLSEPVTIYIILGSFAIFLSIYLISKSSSNS